MCPSGWSRRFFYLLARSSEEGCESRMPPIRNHGHCTVQVSSHRRLFLFQLQTCLKWSETELNPQLSRRPLLHLLWGTVCRGPDKYFWYRIKTEDFNLSYNTISPSFHLIPSFLFLNPSIPPPTCRSDKCRVVSSTGLRSSGPGENGASGPEMNGIVKPSRNNIIQGTQNNNEGLPPWWSVIWQCLFWF